MASSPLMSNTEDEDEEEYDNPLPGSASELWRSELCRGSVLPCMTLTWECDTGRAVDTLCDLGSDVDRPTDITGMESLRGGTGGGTVLSWRGGGGGGSMDLITTPSSLDRDSLWRRRGGKGGGLGRGSSGSSGMLGVELLCPAPHSSAQSETHCKALSDQQPHRPTTQEPHAVRPTTTQVYNTRTMHCQTNNHTGTTQCTTLSDQQSHRSTTQEPHCQTNNHTGLQYRNHTLSDQQSHSFTIQEPHTVRPTITQFYNTGTTRCQTNNHTVPQYRNHPMHHTVRPTIMPASNTRTTYCTTLSDQQSHWPISQEPHTSPTSDQQ